MPTPFHVLCDKIRVYHENMLPSGKPLVDLKTRYIDLIQPERFEQPTNGRLHICPGKPVGPSIYTAKDISLKEAMNIQSVIRHMQRIRLTPLDRLGGTSTANCWTKTKNVRLSDGSEGFVTEVCEIDSVLAFVHILMIGNKRHLEFFQMALATTPGAMSACIDLLN